MFLEELILLECEEGHKFYVPNNQLINEEDEEISLDKLSYLWRNDFN